MCKKVLILTPFYPPNVGGAETFSHDLFKESNKACSMFSGVVRNQQKNWRGLPFEKALFLIPALFLKGFSKCWKNDINTICAVGLIAGTVGMILKKIFKTKLIIISLSIYDFIDRPYFSKVAGWIMNHVDTIFTESEMTRRDLLHAGVHCLRIKKFEHWVDQERFCPVSHNNIRLKVLFIGRPIREKGKHIIQEVENQMPEVDFEYIENMPFEDLPRHYQMADILVVPSLCSESPNRVVAEGASCGCVVITSDKGALPEQVYGFGIVVEPMAKNFVKIISRFDKDRETLKAMRGITIRHAREHFNVKNAEVIIGEY